MKIITFFFFLLFTSNCLAQTYTEYLQEAVAYYESNNFVAAHENYAKAFLLEQNSATDLYNGAIAAAAADKKTDAVAWFGVAIDKGWNELFLCYNEPSFEALRKTDEWRTVTTKLETKLGVKYEQALVDELISVHKTDQSIRKKCADAQKILGKKHAVLDSLNGVMQITDSLNFIKVAKILDEKGWLGRNIIGDGNTTLFEVVQHSTLKNQLKYLPMLREAVKKSNAKGSALCLLEDRIASNQGQKQLYGTQVGTRKKTKQAYLLPTEDPDNLDKRRIEMGLKPIAEYLKRWEIVWDVEVYKKQLPEIEQWAKEDYPKDYK